MKITRGEALRVLRRRNGETQAAAARRFGVEVHVYQEWESGRRVPPAVGTDFRLTRPEELAIIRRRKGLTQRRLAVLAGVSPLWVTLVESGRGNPCRLEDYFAGRP